MKKTIFKSLSLLALITINSYAVTGESTILEQVRAEKVEDFKSNITSIKDRLNNFILNTADLTITRKEMQEFDNLPYFFFNNFEGTSCSNNGTYCNAQTGTDGINISITDRDASFSNVLGTSPNTFVVQSFLQSTDNARTVTSSNGYTAKYPFDTKTRNFIDLIRKIEVIPTAYIGITAPSDTSKTWYLPNGNGGFELKRYNSSTGIWDSIGSTGTDGTSSVQANSEAELFQIPCLKNDKGYVIQEGKGAEYICSSDGSWNTVSTGTLNGLFNGDSSIYAMATSLIGKAGGSIATASDPFSTGTKFVFSGAKNFTKKDNSSTKGYWIDSTNTFIVGSSLADISTQSWADGSYAYIPNSSGSVHLLKRINNKWIFVADGYSDVVQSFPDMLTQQIWDKKNNQYFKYSNYVWYSTTLTGTNDNVSALTSSNSGRNVFSPSSLTTYYTLVNDCTDLTCNGTIANTYFSGITKDNMYTFYYSTNGKRKNNLIDAQTFSSLLNLYQSIADPSTGLVTSTGKVYSRSLDSNGNEIYMDMSNNTYYTGYGIAVPSNLVVGGIVQFPSLTPVVKGENASFSGNYLQLPTWEAVTDWTNAPSGASATANGKSWIKQITGIYGRWLSTDNAIQITKGSRTNLVNPLGSTMVNLTRIVGTEPNYTTSGVPYSANTNFLQWFYSSSGSRVNSLLDNPCVTLSNVGSYTFWIADFPNSRCSRTVNNSYSAIRQVWWGFPVLGIYNNYCQVVGGENYTEGTRVSGYTCSFYRYTCLSGGTLSGSTCTKIDAEYKAFSSF